MMYMNNEHEQKNSCQFWWKASTRNQNKLVNCHSIIGVVKTKRLFLQNTYYYTRVG